MITSALEALHARKWLVELIVLLVVAGAIWWGCSALIEKGVQKQKDDDAKVTAQLTLDAAKETGRLQARADTAEQAYTHEHQDNQDYRAAHPVGLSQLCNTRARPSNLPSASTAHGGNEGSPAAAELGERVPTPDNGQPYDRAALLGAFAALFDDKNAVIREFQAR